MFSIENGFRGFLIKAKELEEDIAAVVLVNPTYQGYCADMESLIKEIHSHSLPVWLMRLMALI